MDIAFESGYRAGSIKMQRLSLMPRVPQIEGLFVPSPDIDPHKNSLIKLLCFMPMHASAEMDDQGNPLDPYECLYNPTGRMRLEAPSPDKTTNINPYERFIAVWNDYYKNTILEGAKIAKNKLDKRMEWPTLWECEEVVRALLQLAEDYDKEELLTPADTQRVKDTLQKAAQHDDEEGPGQNEPENEEQPVRLTVHEYCCFMVAKFVNNLDGFARAKAAPKTKTYALDRRV